MPTPGKIRSVDKESRKPRVTHPLTKRRSVPTKNADSDSDEYISSQSDSELEQQVDLPYKDDSRRPALKDKTSRPRDKKDTSEQQAQHVNKESDIKTTSVAAATHMVMRSAVYHMRLAPLTFPNVSTYIPSFYMFYFALNSAHTIVHDNTYLTYLAPHYITVASSLYYGILGFIQILRAKSIAGNITRPESQTLRRFEREFPFESLPIMSPMIMFFQNLGAVKLSDPMYSWICPTLPTQIGTAANVAGIFATSDNIMLPNVPALLRFLYEMGTASDFETVIDDQDRLAPASRVAGNSNFFGIDLSAGHHANVDFQRLTYSAGMLTPPEIPNNLDDNTLRRIRRWNLPVLTSATDLQTVGQFLQADGNLEWFKNLINLCTQEARFFKGSTNLSNIPPTTGLSSLIEIKVTSRVSPTAIDDIYPFSTSEFSSDLWKFTGLTTRGETLPEEFGIGATTQFLTTSFTRLTPIGHASPAPVTTGAYFDATLNGRQVTQIESDTTRTPRVAFEQIIRENLYDETGGQT